MLVTERDERDVLPANHGLGGVTCIPADGAAARVGDLRSRRIATVVVLDGATVRQPSLLAELAMRHPDVPVVVATSGDETGSVALARAVRRPAGTGELIAAIRRASTSAAQQRALLLSGLFLQSIVDQALDAIFVADRQGIVTLWNGGAERIFGIAASDVIGQALSAVLPTNEGRRLHSLIVGISPDGPAREEEIAWPTARGLREVAVSLSLVRDAEGSGIAVSAIGRDVTERTAMHRELERTAEALAASNRHKDEFLAVLSHELRTPLNTVMGWTQFLEKTPDDPQRVRRAAAMIRRNNELQLRLVMDLLDYARISAGRFELQVEDADVAVVAADAVASLRPQIDARSIGLGERYAAGARARIDRARIGQALGNLIGNAIKFTPAGGRVDVSVERNGDAVRLQVADTGRGIAPEFLPHVFEAFRQADPSTSRSEHGLGLGLAITRRIVELHHGRISAASEGIGRGATFTIELPALP